MADVLAYKETRPWFPNSEKHCLQHFCPSAMCPSLGQTHIYVSHERTHAYKYAHGKQAPSASHRHQAVSTAIGTPPPATHAPAPAALTSGPAPEPSVEYDSIATRGSMPKAAAVSALHAAMLARSLLLGVTLTAQSPYTNTCSSSEGSSSSSNRTCVSSSRSYCLCAWAQEAGGSNMCSNSVSRRCLLCSAAGVLQWVRATPNVTTLRATPQPLDR
jgi:hypothetical protein